MDAASDPATQYMADITRLIAEIEACIHLHEHLREREARLQRVAFQERRQQAECLLARLSAGTSQWPHLDGDAQRILDALALSLAYFRNQSTVTPGRTVPLKGTVPLKAEAGAGG